MGRVSLPNPTPPTSPGPTPSPDRAPPKSNGAATSDEAPIAEHKKKLSAAMKQITANCNEYHVKYRD